MNERELLGLCEEGLSRSLTAGADEAEVFATYDSDLEVAFQKNDLDRVSVSSEIAFGIRVFKNGRMGFATSNRPDSLADTCADAVAMARVTPTDPLNRLSDPRPLEDIPAQIDPSLLDIDPATLTQLGVSLLRQVKDKDSRIAIDTAGVSIGENTTAIASSTGTRAHHRSTSGHGHIFGMAIDGAEVGSFAYDGDVVRRWEDMESTLSVAFLRFADRCTGALGARTGESFRGPIIVPPETIGDLFLRDLIKAMGADGVRKAKTPLAEQLGERIANPLLTVWERGTGIGWRLTPFDREGQPRTAIPLISEGVLSSFLYNCYEARATGCASTGHAGGLATMLPHVAPACVHVSPGDTPASEMEQVPRGVVVTRFSGSTNSSSGDFSGVVKGGFLIRDGERIPIRETTISGNLYECLRNISAVSNETTRFYGTRDYPSFRVEDVSVTAG